MLLNSFNKIFIEIVFFYKLFRKAYQILNNEQKNYGNLTMHDLWNSKKGK